MLAMQLHPNKKNRRSSVQWHIPLQSMWVISIVSQSVTGSVPQVELDGYAIHDAVGVEVVEDSWGVVVGEGVGGVADEKTSFANVSVADNNQLHLLRHVSGPKSILIDYLRIAYVHV